LGLSSGTGVFAAVFHDVTERKEAQAALERERDLVRRIMETSPVGITALDRTGTIVFANLAAERIFGMERGEVEGRVYNQPDWYLTDYEGRSVPDEDEVFRRVMNTGLAVYNVQHAIRRADGLRVLLSINAAPIFNGAGELDGMVAALEDVTERKRAEEELRQSEARLRDAQRLALLGNWEEDLVTRALIWSEQVFRIFEEDRSDSVLRWGLFGRVSTPRISTGSRRRLPGGRRPRHLRSRAPDSDARWAREACA
jgi:PAS domain S-box-containing protein